VVEQSCGSNQRSISCNCYCCYCSYYCCYSSCLKRRGGGCTPRLPHLTSPGCGGAESWQQATLQQLQL
jgi:hypothetical protein